MEVLGLYLVAGVVAGIMAGLLGVGGGIVVVPALALALELQGVNPSLVMHMAIGTSLATIVLTAVASILAHHRRGAVSWSVVGRIAPGLVVGALLGAGVADLLSGTFLRACFGVFALMLAGYLLVGPDPKPHRRPPGPWTATIAGTLIGAISSLVGIGGGSMVVPFLVWSNVPMRKAIATSAACGFPIAMAGSIGFLLAGADVPHLPPLSIGYVYWPACVGVGAASILFAPLGAKLAHTLPPSRLRLVFAALLVLIGGYMLFT